ncbi:exodeoxyribonuclease V subunit gamma [Pantoea sp. 1.19]|uniref:exodeoxyribonuclease V subunit gamma n=1 Tax=Pantoea sp. 1.19 TaxID=1925589 RepID=UPI000948A7E3|nr:exodeoxyribonuclease V subunit gamma [Pantoea sp. 1.19]
MFTVYHSNRLDLLKELAVYHIRSQPLADPFQQEVMLVQSPGMAQWLQMSLASELGIAANVHFPLPATFIWQMFVAVLPEEIPKESAFNKASMSWKLMTLLPAMLQQPDFSQLSHYLADDDDQRKLFQLAGRIADLFDQYLVYRPEWLTAWERGETVAGVGEAQRWQGPLWRELVNLTCELGQPGWHRANLYRRFISTLEQAKHRPAGLPDRVFICGISALPPVYMQALQALGKHIDIHLLFTNPCRHYWGDIQDYAFLARLQSRRRRHYQSRQEHGLFRVGEDPAARFSEAGEQQLTHPLLASWGKLGRDNLWQLAQMEGQEIDAFVDIPDDTLLHRIQQDILELEDRALIGTSAGELASSAGKRLLNPYDRSLTFNLCHSPQREVEILQDRLLAMMEADPDLTARDIIVMVADIDAYTPFIQAVFGNAPGDRWLPFAISDRRASHAHPVLPAFLALLSLPDSRFAAEQVLALLEVPALAARFAIGEEGLQRLRLWVAESGVRWGLDDDNVRALGLPVTGQHTWRFGLQRMLMGYAMESEAGEWQGVLPYDESSGLVAELAGNLADLLERLSHWRQRLERPRELNDWLPLCGELLADFFLADAESEAALTLVASQWQQILSYGQQARFADAVPLTILRDELTSRLEQERISQRFLAGSINFCTLMPMRSIPFRVVCLLGMNDGVYPRNLPPLGFDLMSETPRKGDRSRRDDDRYLFLEAMLSARDCLWISYIGRAIQDNSERYPSVLVSELLDYAAQSHCLPGDEARDLDSSAARVATHLQVLHSRTPFAAENFMPNAPQPSFAREWLAAASGGGEAQANFIQPLAPLKPETLSFEQLVRFWRHPVRAFFTQRLGVSFYDEESELPDAEPFALASLDRYQLNQQLLNCLIQEQSAEALYARYRAAGALPFGAWGELFWQGQQQEMLTLAGRVREQLAPGESVEINLPVAGLKLCGWLARVQPDGLLRWRPGILNAKDGLSLWLEHLAWCASGGQGSSRMLGRKDSLWHFPPLSQQAAGEWLTRYVEGYLSGICSPLLLLPACAEAWLSVCYDTRSGALLEDEATRAAAQSKLMQAWTGNWPLPGEGSDAYLQRLFRQPDEQQVGQMVTEARRWLLPLLQFHQPERS